MRRLDHQTPGYVGGPAARVFAVIVEHHDRTGYATTFGEVARAVGSTRSTVWHHCWRLRTRGLVTWDAGRSRTLRPAIRVVAVTPDRRNHVHAPAR